VRGRRLSLIAKSLTHSPNMQSEPLGRVVGMSARLTVIGLSAKRTHNQLARFSSSNSESLATKAPAALKLSPAMSFINC
jgi:hypothetical protein